MILYLLTLLYNSFKPTIISKAFFIVLYLFHQITTFKRNLPAVIFVEKEIVKWWQARRLGEREGMQWEIRSVEPSFIHHSILCYTFNYFLSLHQQLWKNTTTCRYDVIYFLLFLQSNGSRDNIKMIHAQISCKVVQIT